MPFNISRARGDAELTFKQETKFYKMYMFWSSFSGSSSVVLKSFKRHIHHVVVFSKQPVLNDMTWK